MKKFVVILGLLLACGAAGAAAQTRWRLSPAFGYPRPFVSGFVAVGRPAPLIVYRPWRPVVVYPRPFVFERVYTRRCHGRFRPYHSVRACWRRYRCGY